LNDGGDVRAEGTNSIAWTITKRVEDTEATQLNIIARWRENIKFTRIHTIAWIWEMEGKQLFLLAELHPRYTIIPTILP